MKGHEPWPTASTDAARIARGTVIGLDDRLGGRRVRCCLEDQEEIICDLLHSLAGRSDPLAPGDSVLVWCPSREGEPAVVLGWIGGTSDAVPKHESDEL